MVIHHLYQNDQFFGFSGSSGPSQVTTFGSVLGLGRNGSDDAEVLLFFTGGSCGSLPPLHSKRASSRLVSSFIGSCSSCKIVVVEEHAGEVGALLVLVIVREEEREQEGIVRGVQVCR